MGDIICETASFHSLFKVSEIDLVDVSCEDFEALAFWYFSWPWFDAIK